ncbi:hypothetical protein KDK_37580 [Dictyobacter kobayashii]|uniref:Uncharacterized protein n=1 Tax=Dictyobacter kobayashii TaxID=2014872 RepID=A0A402AL81_9CHLR|nr:hypothetical protein KDK_37580 [Dictyobacter kobayashii]
MLEIPPTTPEHLTGRPNWRHIGAFLGLTFGFTWLLDLLIYWHGGLGTPGSLSVVQLQMLFPAFSAIVLGMFFFPESPLYYRRPAGRGRWFYSSFLLLTVISALGILGAYLGPAQGTVRLVAAIVPQVLAFVGLLLLIVLRLVAGYWPGLFHCYDHADLPRTNNALEQYFGLARYHERRITGRKQAPSLVVRGPFGWLPPLPPACIPFLEQSFVPLISRNGELCGVNCIIVTRHGVCSIVSAKLLKATSQPSKRSSAKKDYRRRKKHKE